MIAISLISVYIRSLWTILQINWRSCLMVILDFFCPRNNVLKLVFWYPFWSSDIVLILVPTNFEWASMVIYKVKDGLCLQNVSLTLIANWVELTYLGSEVRIRIWNFILDELSLYFFIHIFTLKCTNEPSDDILCKLWGLQSLGTRKHQAHAENNPNYTGIVDIRH